MEKVFGFSSEYTTITPDVNNNYFSYYNNSFPASDISGYQYMFDAGQFKSPDNTSASTIKDVTLNTTKNTVSITKNGANIYKYNMNALAGTFYKKYGANKPEGNELTFDDQTANIKVKYLFKDITGNINSDGTVEVTDFNATILVQLLK